MRRRKTWRGAVACGAARAVAGWVLHLRGLGSPVSDPMAGELARLASGDLAGSVRGILEFLGVSDEPTGRMVLALAQELLGLRV